jgi:hypothetical protein
VFRISVVSFRSIDESNNVNACDDLELILADGRCVPGDQKLERQRVRTVCPSGKNTGGCP